MSAKNTTMPIVMSWLGIVASRLFAATIIGSYVTWQASLGNLSQSIAESIDGIASSAERTALTVESGQEVLVETVKMMSATRTFVDAMRTAADNQSKMAPQYAEGLRSASALGKKASETMQFVGAQFQTLGIPNGVSIREMRLTFWHPLGQLGSDLTEMAPQVRGVSDSLATVSDAISRDAKDIAANFIAASDQANIVLAGTQKTLDRVKSLDLPQTAKVLRDTSTNLRHASSQISNARHIATALLVAGLLLASWCFLNSFATLTLARSHREILVGGSQE